MFDIEKIDVLIVPRIIPNILSLNHDDLSRETEKTLRQGRPPRESEEGAVRCGRRAMRGDQQRHF